MEQIQRYYVKFNSTSLDIHSIGLTVFQEDGYVILPTDWNLIKPFFTLEKNPAHYYPLTKDKTVVGFRRKALFENQIVLNTEGNVVKSLRSFENFIADCKIVVGVDNNQITLSYDSNYFDPISNGENIERLKLAQDRMYNMYITRRGDPYTVLGSYETTLTPFIENQSITIPWNNNKDISVYAVAKD